LRTLTALPERVVVPRGDAVVARERSAQSFLGRRFHGTILATVTTSGASSGWWRPPWKTSSGQQNEVWYVHV
jgi:hypothetical protein